MADTKVGNQLDILLERCVTGDQEAFAQLYCLSAPKLFALACSIVGRKEWAEEVLQVSFLNIWHHANTYDPARGTAMAWMAGIVRHRALDVRCYARREILENEVTDVSMRSENHSTPEDQCLHTAESQPLWSCLEQLPDKQRHSILLAYFRGFTHRELADYLGVPLGTVKAWNRRGLQHLKSTLDHTA